MPKRGKSYKEAVALFDKQTYYETAEAFDHPGKDAKAKFDETVEVHIRLGVDSRPADQQVRGCCRAPAWNR